MSWSERSANAPGTARLTRAPGAEPLRGGLLFSGLLFIGLVLAACSFQPLYGPQGAGTALDRRVAVAEPRSTRDYVMARELELAFGPASDPAYRLDYRLAIRSEDAAITSGQEIDRVNLIGTLRYTLVALPGGARVTQGTADGFVSFSSAGEPVATNAAREDAELRLARILAERTLLFVLANPRVAADAAEK